MTITELHLLARNQLHGLATARWMPRGWNYEDNRKVESKQYELGKHLTGILQAVPDKLMPYPSKAVMDNLLATAAKKRLLRDMVAKMVELLQALPTMDQQDANLLAEINVSKAQADRLRWLVDETTEKFQAFQEATDLLQLDMAPLLTELSRFKREIHDRANTLEANRSRLSEF